MPKKKDLTNVTFGRLTAIVQENKSGTQLLWKCICECGNICYVTTTNLSIGKTKSCGCLHKDGLINRNTKHGYSKRSSKAMPEYKAWSQMKTRCYNKDNPDFNLWGGRGIKVCDRWLNSFENFISDMGMRPSNRHSLDRFPDTNGEYEPTNCRWATSNEQSRNRRSTILNASQASEIYKSNLSERKLAKLYGVSKSNVHNIKHLRCWIDINS